MLKENCTVLDAGKAHLSLQFNKRILVIHFGSNHPSFCRRSGFPTSPLIPVSDLTSFVLTGHSVVGAILAYRLASITRRLFLLNLDRNRVGSRAATCSSIAEVPMTICEKGRKVWVWIWMENCVSGLRGRRHGLLGFDSLH